MNKYKVYKHPVIGYEAIKTGFSWPAFLFSWVWAFIKRLWLHGVGLLFAAIILQSIGSAIGGLKGPDSTFILLLLGIPIIIIVFVGPGIIAGVYGNKWRENTMTARGFKYLETVEAGAPDGAIASVAETNEP